MSVQPFPNHRTAALALLSNCPDISYKTAGFLGNVCVASELSAKQYDWLLKLLAKYELPPLAEEEAAIVWIANEQNGVSGLLKKGRDAESGYAENR